MFAKFNAKYPEKLIDTAGAASLLIATRVCKPLERSPKPGARGAQPQDHSARLYPSPEKQLFCQLANALV